MANYTNHSNNKPLATELIAEIKRRVEVNGEKKTHVALELGISHSAVRKYTAPKPHLITKETKDEVIALVKKGASNSEVAKRLGISRCTVGKLTPGISVNRLQAARIGHIARLRKRQGHEGAGH